MQIFDRPPPPPRRPRLPAFRVPRLRLPLPALLRRPLAWLVAAEVVVCVALVGAAWHLVATTAVAAATAPALPSAVAAPAPSDSPPPAFAQPGGAPSPHPTARPGLGLDGRFLGGLLDGLNADQAAFENGEWSALQALSVAIRLYIERVMVPAVEKAERSGAR